MQQAQPVIMVRQMHGQRPSSFRCRASLICPREDPSRNDPFPSHHGQGLQQVNGQQFVGQQHAGAMLGPSVRQQQGELNAEGFEMAATMITLGAIFPVNFSDVSFPRCISEALTLHQ